MPQLLWCYSTVHPSPRRSSPRYYQRSPGKRPHPQGKDSNVSREHSSFIRILHQKHLLFLPRPVLWTGWVCGYGFPSKSHCSKPIYGVFWAKSGKFNLPHIWDRVLHNTPGLTLKRHVQAFGHTNSNQHSTQLNQPNLRTHLDHPKFPIQFFTGSEHAHRTS